jgi:Protein of unknown function (DUF4232)
VAVLVALGAALAGCAGASPTADVAPTRSVGSATTGSTGSTASTASVGGATPACTGSQLRQSVASDGVAGGHAGEAVIFTNISSSKCYLGGYPGVAVSYINGSKWSAQRTMSTMLGGAQPTSSGPGSPTGYPSPPTVALLPGAAASATVAWTEVTPDDEWPCQNLNYPMMLITAPNTKTTVTYWATPSHQAISTKVGGFSCETLQVTPVIPGTAGRVPN